MALLVGCLIAAVAVAGEQEVIVSSCEGLYKDRELTPEDLAIVLSNHRAWLESRGELDDKRRANLCRAQLDDADLRGADLRGANLQEAVLWRINWRGTELHAAQLDDADLRRADLRGALLREAKLRGAQLDDADLRGANLLGADLQKAKLRGTNLQGAWLPGANLQGAGIVKADLQKANLQKANLQKAVLWEAKLQGAQLSSADLRGALLDDADLRGVNFQRVRLEDANLSAANLQGANLIGADLAKANFEGANLASIEFMIGPGPFPDIRVLAHAHNLMQVLDGDMPRWVELREAFKKAGFRAQERKVTYAIKREERLQAGAIESAFHFILFELPSGYGMVPGRTLQTLGLLIVLFSVPYMVAVITRREAGIWMVWLPDRVHKAEGEVNPIRVTSTFFFSPLKMRAASRWWRGLSCGLSVILIGLYFSLLSAFSLGWRELNVGTWIARVQPREYTLRPTGWVRTVSGIQSLLSVYLLALWVLTYFGRPFE